MKPQSEGASLRIAKHQSTKSAIVSKRGLRKLVDGTVVVLETFRHHCVSLCRGCMMVCACISGVYVTTTCGGGHYSPKPPFKNKSRVGSRGVRVVSEGGRLLIPSSRFTFTSIEKWQDETMRD